MRCNPLLCFFALLVMFTASACPVVAQEIPDDIEGMASYLGFRGADVSKLLRGEVIEVKGQIEEGSDKEMAVGVAILLPTTLDKAMEIIRSGRRFAVDPSVIDYRRMSRGAPSEADFADLGYTADEVKEVQQLLKVKAGSKFNVSQAEVERFRRLAKALKGKNVKKDPSVREAVNAELRAILLERYLAYRQGGLEAIEPYSRGKKKQSSPAEELTLAVNEDALRDERLAPLIRENQQAWINYPEGGGEGIENDFFWAKTDVQGRPCFVLTHVMSFQDSKGGLIAERQFYVGHDYNSLNLVMGAVPVEGGIVMFYRNRTFTDQVAGFGSDMKKGIGRGQMHKTIVKLFKEAERQLEQGELE
ncbi:MAG: hypothetical protein ACYTES_01395 [Planctomycetota bacterium]|jgi:hypothetical protein